MASLFAIYGEKANFEKTSEEFLDVFWVWKVDLTAEIKISENVISLLGALYMESWIRLTNVCVCSMKTKCVCIH